MKILLLCNAGMSTGILAKKMENEAAKRDVELEIIAVSITQLDNFKDEVQAILLAPQIGFALNELKKELGDSIPIIRISPVDFGLMNASNIVEELLKLLN